MLYRMLFATLVGAVAIDAPYSSALAGDVSLYPPYVYPVAYEHLSRWCGPDTLIVNGAGGQVLLRLEQTEREMTRFNDPVDPAVVEGGAEMAGEAGCLLGDKFHLSYWQASGDLAIHRLEKDPNSWWTADAFRRKEYVRLPSGFQSAVADGGALFAAYRRPCSSGEASASAAGDMCAGVEMIDLQTLDRENVLERRAPAGSQDGVQIPDVNVLREDRHVMAVVADEKDTSFCRIGQAGVTADCHLALDRPIGRRYVGDYRRLTIDETGGAFYEVGENLLYCRQWDDKATNDKPMCRAVTPKIEEKPDADVRLRAVLLDGRALVQVDRCLSIGEVSADTGGVQNLKCLLEPIRAAAPEDVRVHLVEEEIFIEERDGVTIPGWDVSISPTGKWIAVQVPRRGCGESVPEPETFEPRVGIGTCGQVMVWRLDRFVR